MSKKFVISNLPENIAIPSEDKQKPNSRNPGMQFRLNLPGDKSMLSDKELEAQSEEAINELSKMFNLPKEELLKTMDDMGKAIREMGIDNLLGEGSNISKEQADVITNRFMSEIEKLNNKSTRSQDQDNFKVLNSKEDEEKFLDYDEEDIIGEDEDLIPRVNENSSYSIIDTPNSFGMIACEPSPYIYENFKSIYGDHEQYNLDIFVPKIDGYNLIKGLSKIEKIEYINHTDKYIIFKAIPKSPTDEGFVLSLIYSDHEFIVVVPEYGNTYDINTGNLLDVIVDADLYKVSNGEPVLKKPLDLKRIRAGLDLVLYENKKPVLSIANFGKVINSPSAQPEKTDMIKIGRIKSNNSAVSNLFKRDFDFDTDQEVFDFYVKLPDEYAVGTLVPLAKYITNINFNTNKRMQTLELKAVSGSKGYIYVELDLGDFPDNIKKWSKE